MWACIRARCLVNLVSLHAGHCMLVTMSCKHVSINLVLHSLERIAELMFVLLADNPESSCGRSSDTFRLTYQVGSCCVAVSGMAIL